MPPQGGIGKSGTSHPNATTHHDRLREAEDAARNGSLSRQKLEAGMQQASVSRPSANRSEPMDEALDHKQLDELETSSRGQQVYHSQEVLPSIETDGTHGIELQSMEPRNPADAHQHEPRPSQPRGDQASQEVSGLMQKFRRLAVIGPRGQRGLSGSQDEFSNLPVDGWGVYKNTSFVILQQGPPSAVRFVFKYRPGYMTEALPCITNEDKCITSVHYKDIYGKKFFRYTWENVVEIVGVAAEERNPYVSYKTNPGFWVKIEWKNLDDADLDKVVNNYSWIPRVGLERLCGGRKPAKAKIQEVWEQQEEGYLEWVGKNPGRPKFERSPTPCPLVDSASPGLQRRATSRLNTPDVTVFPPERWESTTPVPSRRHGATGIRTDPISIEDQRDQRDQRSSLAPPDSASAAGRPRDSSRSASYSLGPTIQVNEEEFMEKVARRERWNEKSPAEREQAEAKAKALFELLQEGV